MSLDFDLSKVPDEVKQHPNDPKRLNPVTEALIWATMATTIWEITEDNYQRAYVRIAAWEKAFGTYVQALPTTPGEWQGMVDRPITMEDVKNHIGLRTNAFPEISGDAFGAKLYAALRDQIYTRIHQEMGGFAAGHPVTFQIEQAELNVPEDDDADDYDEDEDD